MSKRKSFIVHKDSLDILDDLTDEQAGLLFKAIWLYQKGEEIELPPLVKVAFNPFKHQFIRDEEKYEITCQRRAEAGSKGGKQKVANASKSKQTVANLADNKSKNKNDSKSNIDTFVPNDASYAAVMSTYPSCNINELAEDFKDQARNRAKPFKDLQSGFRNYVRKGWVKPKSYNQSDNRNAGLQVLKDMAR